MILLCRQKAQNLQKYRGKKMEFKRDKYLKELVERQGNHLIKIITGIRRSGKSYLLNSIFYNYLINSGVKSNQIIRFAFDSEEDIHRLDEFNPSEQTIIKKRGQEYINSIKFISFITKNTKRKTNYYLLLDEIQLLDRFESVLNSLLRNDKYDIYVTGSNSKFLSTDIITEFSGRGDEIHLLPLSFSEYLSGVDIDEEKAFQEYIYYGGLPLVQLKKNDSQKMSELNNTKTNVYLSDILKRHHIDNENNLMDTLRVIASSVGSPINPTRIENTFNSVFKTKLTNDTISNYIKWAEESFLIKKVLRYDLQGRGYIGSPFKIYFEDVGLKNTLLDFREIDETDIFENIIYNELRYRGYLVDVGVVEVSEKTNRKDKNGKTIYEKKQLEIDFVANRLSEKIYVQPALTIPNLEKEEQEKRPYKNINDSFTKIIVVKDKIKKHRSREGIVLISIYDFIKDKEW